MPSPSAIAAPTAEPSDQAPIGTRWRRRVVEPPVRRPVGDVVLDVRDVSARRGTRDVLRLVSLSVRAGEVVALVGPNGAGKSSFVGVVAGDLPSSGRIVVDGREIADWSPIELALRRAVQPQQSTVAFSFLAVDIVRMARAPWRRAGARDDDERVVAALIAADAFELAHRPITALSGGERARVALARLLAQDSQLLLLDEPTAALDLGHQELVMRVLRARAEAGDAVVIVLHDLTLAAAHVDRIVVLDRGAVAIDGAPSVVADPDLLAAVYRAPIDVLRHPVTGAPIILPAPISNEL
ncbi:MAG TPA: heme ABC transporter ATP-binding protein [Ilumatobacteraceae bacterium]|nr:heme ABC transporter ATP-binding protein [Ilumatobacteraceae bacterium]